MSGFQQCFRNCSYVGICYMNSVQLMSGFKLVMWLYVCIIYNIPVYRNCKTIRILWNLEQSTKSHCEGSMSAFQHYVRNCSYVAFVRPSGITYTIKFIYSHIYVSNLFGCQKLGILTCTAGTD